MLPRQTKRTERVVGGALAGVCCGDGEGEAVRSVVLEGGIVVVGCGAWRLFGCCDDPGQRSNNVVTGITDCALSRRLFVETYTGDTGRCCDYS